MADMDYFGADYGAEEPSRLAEAAKNFGLVNWAGALTSLGLTAGMAVWAVNMTFRDVSGIPVIAALEGPMRVEPETPGGRVAPFQGMALSDITSGGPAAPAPDEVVLAPPPVTLDAAPLGERIAAASQTAPQPAVTPVVAEAAPEDAPALVPEPALALESDVPAVEPLGVVTEEAALVPAIATAEIATPDIAPDTSPEPLVAADAVADVVASTVPAVLSTERPRLRPLRQVAAVTPVSATAIDAAVQEASVARPAAQTSAVPEVRPEDVAPGTRVVQLGAFDSEALARGEWERLYGQFDIFMDGKSRMIQKARSGGRDFWRLRVVGFDGPDDARRFCTTLHARDAACIPVTMR